MVFLDVLFPVFAIVAIGYALGRGGHLPAESLAKLTFWILTPALIFHELSASEIELDVFVDYGIYIGLLTALFVGLAAVVGRARGLSTDTTSALALSLALPNTANYGLPLLLFAFGQSGFELGIVYVAISTLAMSTIGVAIATWGGRIRWQLLLNIFKTPLVYAVALALLARFAHIELPEFLARPIGLLSDATIPMMLLLLGTQLVGVRLGQRLPLIGTATLIRLGLAPLAGWALTMLLGFSGTLQSTAIIEASMPTAVNAVVLASVYDRDPRLASSVVLATTLASVVTLGLLLTILGG